MPSFLPLFLLLLLSPYLHATPLSNPFPPPPVFDLSLPQIPIPTPPIPINSRRLHSIPNPSPTAPLSAIPIKSRRLLSTANPSLTSHHPKTPTTLRPHHATESPKQIITNYRPDPQHSRPKFANLQHPTTPKVSKLSMQTAKHSTHNHIPSLSRVSMFSVIHPILAAVLTPDRAKPLRHLPPMDPVLEVEYRSSPLKGTEVRDLTALGLTKSPPVFTSNTQASQGPSGSQGLQGTYQQRENAPHNVARIKNHFANAVGGDQYPYENDVPAGSEVSGKVRNGPKLGGEGGKSRMIGDEGMMESESQVRAASGMYTSTLQDSSHHVGEVEAPRLPMAALKNTTLRFWNKVVDNVRRTIEKLRVSKGKEPHSSSVMKERKDKVKDEGYTEEDLNSMIDDMMRQIQFKSEDAQAHREMLTANNRWNANDDTGGGPLMMVRRSKVVMDPDIVAEALVNSARKLITSKKNQKSKDATIDLLKAVQIKLVELLRLHDV